MNELAIAEGYTREQIELVKATVAKGATDDELKLFLMVAKRTGLDPFSKQLHFVKRKSWDRATNSYKDVGSIQTGIDGYRAIAERSKELGGEDDAVFDDETKSHPNKASVTVYRFVQGNKASFTATARWTEYAVVDKDGNATAMWKKMPYLMLAKCASALAYRKAYPSDLSGLYTNEEMQQADRPALAEEYDTTPIHKNAVPVITYDDPDMPARTHEVEEAEDIPQEAEKPPTKAKTAKLQPPKSIANSREAMRKEIKELCDSIVMVPLVTGEEYRDWVLQNTQQELIPENYATIARILTKIKNGETEPNN